MENPVLYREALRSSRARQRPKHLMALFGWVLWTTLLLRADPADLGFVNLAILSAFFIYAYRAAMTVGRSFQSERRGQTLESVLITPTAPREHLQAWLMAAGIPLWLEALAGGLLLLLLQAALSGSFRVSSAAGRLWRRHSGYLC